MCVIIRNVTLSEIFFHFKIKFLMSWRNIRQNGNVCILGWAVEQTGS